MSRRIRPELIRLPEYHVDQPPHRIKLNQNESPYDLPAELKSEVLARLETVAWNRYPTPYATQLSEKIAQANKWEMEGVLVANGSNVLTQALIAVTAIGGSLVLPDPTFSLYEIYGRFFKNKIYRVPLQEDFALSPDRFIRKVERYRPQIVFLANPNAPTGRLIPPEDLERMIQAVRGLVVVDEAYFPFSGETCLPLLKRYPQLVILRTFSKAFSLGGVRVGYILAAPDVVKEVRKGVPPFCVSVINAAIAEALLDNPRFVMRLVNEVIAERERVYEALTELTGLVAHPSRANFILFRTARAQKIYRGLVEAGILIRNISDSYRLKNCLRVTIGTPKENDRFLAALKKLL